MAGTFNNQRTSFASGEVNPSIRAANDLARFQTGAELVENLVVMIEAILTRRPGTRFILELKDQTQRGKMVPFRYSGSDYYVLGFNGGKMRVLKDQGFLESSPGVLFELSVPWLEADMANLRTASSGNILMQVASGRPPQKLTRNGHTSWTIEQFRPKNGPVDAQNLDTTITIQASGTLGAGVNLVGTGSPFTSGQVDGVFRLDEPNQSIVPLWQANETITLTTESVSGATGTIGDVTSAANAFDGNNATTADKVTTTTAYVGRVVSPASSILSARVRMGNPAPGAGGTITLQLYMKSGTPSSGTDGTLLAQTAYDVDLDGSNDHTLTSSDTVTAGADLWVRAIYSGAALTMKFAEVVLTRLAVGTPPVLRRWQGNVYQALTSGNTGINAPVHTEGDVAAGSGNVTWRYLHSGYGFIQITAFTDANHATGTVLSRLPDSVVSTATYRWWPPAWSADAGFPKQVATHDQRAYFARDNIYWMTQPLTIDDFELTTLEDSAIARRLSAPDGSFVQIEWALSSGVMVQGTRDFEWLTRPPGDNEGLTSANVRDIPDEAEGSAPHIPAVVDKGAVFIGRSRQRLHYVKFARLAQELTIQEISVASRHMFKAGAVAIAWQRDPHRLLWIALADGTLACGTLMPDEKIIAFTRCPMTNCFVEDLVAIPTADNGRADVYLQTRRTINSATKRYYELLMPFFDPLSADMPTAAGAWFVDCGLHYQGAPATTISGLGHLEGQTVAVFADGAEQSRKVVTSGSITLDAAAADVVVGLPVQWKFRDLPRDVTVQGQSSKGAPKRASHIVIDVRHAAGGKATFNASEPELLTETGANDYDAAIPLKTGPVRLSIASATEDEGVLELVGDNALPFTLLATTPDLEVEDLT